MAAISCLYFGSLPFYKDWINVRLRLCYCCSALCLTLIQSWGTLVVTGKDDNYSGFSNAKFAIMSACRLSCLWIWIILDDVYADFCRGAGSLSHIGGFRVGGGVHDSYTFQCGLVGSFTSPGIDTR